MKKEQELIKTENEIFEHFKGKVENIYSKEAQEVIETEIRNRDYLSEDWQIGYAVERIQEKIAEDRKKQQLLKEKIDNPINETEILWSKFKRYFWIIFFVKVVFRYAIIGTEGWSNFIFYTLGLEEVHLMIINLFFQLVPAILMAYVMGYYAYKISGDYKKRWKGLWGFLWIGTLLIFVGYLAVKRERDNKLKNNERRENVEKIKSASLLGVNPIFLIIKEKLSKLIKFVKQNYLKIGIVLILIFVIGGVFYWYELRPAKIKHDCSWIERYSDAIPERTQAQYDQCIMLRNIKPPSGSAFADFVNSSFCETSHPAEPAKSWWERSSKQYYDFCIHEKGL